MVDVGVILSENMIRHQEDDKLRLNANGEEYTTNEIIYNATSEVSGAILTAVLTTIISFLPLFTMIGAEGKLFRPLAFTKTMALTASLVIALFLIPPIAAFLFRKRNIKTGTAYVVNGLFVLLGITAVIYGFWLGLLLVAFGIIAFLKLKSFISTSQENLINIGVSTLAIVMLLATYWRPLGFDRSIILNLIFVSIICFGLLGVFAVFRRYYDQILRWALKNRLLFLTISTTVLLLGFLIMRNTGKEFMPALNEGSFLLMPTSLPHAGVEENKRVLQQLDMAVAGIPEIETVVGKSGRTESALDPAPLSMYENMIQYKSEYMRNSNGDRQRYKVNNDGLFVLKNGQFVINPNNKINEDASYKASKLKTTGLHSKNRTKFPV